jgi:SAM-dependent methyltransferase
MEILILGVGHSRDLRIKMQDHHNALITTVDFNPEVQPNVVWDLNDTPWPFKTSRFDEVHAYEVLEHLGAQGDYHAFFNTFSEIWRVLKPDGLLCASCPSASGVWAWGDPGHTRIVSGASLVFLSQLEYAKQLDGEHVTSMSDYRNVYFADFDIVQSMDDCQTHLFILKAVKPSRRSV